jgi:predicted NUDIX family NTP pyrophosphohydrolase
VPARSAGLILFRRPSGPGVEVLLVHMGGPFWARRDERAWSIPKGEYADPEQPLAAARREFAEELGHKPPAGEAIELAELSQPNGKRIRAWAMEGDMDPSRMRSNTFQMEWPPRSKQMREFPEVDRAAWFDLDSARAKLVVGQVPFIDLLARQLGLKAPAPAEPDRPDPVHANPKKRR